MRHAVSDLTPRRAGVAAGVGIAVIVTLGLWQIATTAYTPAVRAGVFDLDGERTVPAAFSALLLFAAGAAAFALGRQLGRTRWFALAAFLTFMALDEGLAIHDRVEGSIYHDWQVVYLPVIAAGAAAWLAVLRALGGQPAARRIYVAGAVAWTASQLVEFVQWRDGPEAMDVVGYVALMTTEETLEMIGSALFGIALLCVLRSVDGSGARRR